jgi:glc operon protein GlcG
MHQIRTLGAQDAQFAIDTINAEVESRGMAAVIAVADVRGEMIALLRMDNADIASLQIAQNKAFTAARLKKSSKSVGTRVRDAETGHDIAYLSDPRYIGWGGGIPVFVEGECVGAVAMSGLPEATDIEICEATVAKLVDRLTSN